MARPFVLGLTGNIACGKSTVLAMLADLGAVTIDADHVYLELIRPDLPLWQALRDRFGDGILAPDREIDRRALAAIVFSNPAALADLDALTHPAVIDEVRARIAALDAAVVVIDAVKLIESGMDADCDQVWLVTCDPLQQIDRLMRRNHLSRPDAQRRVAAQPPLAPKLARADLVIDNSGTIEETRRQVEAAWGAVGEMRLSLEPATSIRGAIRLPTGKLREQGRRALAAIDRVHRDGNLPAIPLGHHRDDPRFEGQYRFRPNDGRILGIGIDPDGPVPEFAILHEVGHFLDHQTLGKQGKFASPDHRDLASWRTAVRQTVPCRRLYQLSRMDDLAFVRAVKSSNINRDRANVRYLLRYNEIWARSYAQYVAIKSQDPALMWQLAKERADSDSIFALSQWADDDFAPVEEAIDALFREKGWLG